MKLVILRNDAEEILTANVTEEMPTGEISMQEYHGWVYDNAHLDFSAVMALRCDTVKCVRKIMQDTGWGVWESNLYAKALKTLA